MISFLEKYKRALVLLVIMALLSIAAVTLIENAIEFTGTLLLSTSLLLFVYIPISSYYIAKRNSETKLRFYNKEKWLLTILIGVLLLIATIDSATKLPIFAIIFGQALLVYSLYVYYHLIRSLGTNEKDAERSKIPKWFYWIFFIGNALLIVLLEDMFTDKEHFGIAVLTYILTFAAFIVFWLFRQIRTIFQLQQIQKTTELKHLQSQVNPHFFFNMLNNLYGWVEKDTKKAQEIILQLSDMMRYSIYDGQEEYVYLEQEISYLKNFTNLHMSRYQKNIDINFETQIDFPDIKIKPLLLIILVENAFKHGVEKLRQNAYVKMSLTANSSSLNFTIENNFDVETRSERQGIGLQNLRRRLELAYPDKYKLITDVSQNVYRSDLSIQHS